MKIKTAFCNSIFLCIFLFVLSGCTSLTKNKEYLSDVDYSKNENWAFYEQDSQKKADVFLVCPTVDLGDKGNKNMSLVDNEIKQSFVSALNMEVGIYNTGGNIYSPFYKQITFPVYSDPNKEEYTKIAYADVKKAFEYFLNNISNDRPIIIAGFSQGSEHALQLLKDFFKDSDLQKRLVAAYLIGWRVMNEDLKYSWLKMAQGEKDTGVIIAFNSEDVSVNDSLMVPSGVKTYGINPLNWKTDSTPAEDSLNIGACFLDYSGNITAEIPGLCGAYIDENRGTLRITGDKVSPEKYPGVLFENGIYHLYDYQFFYRNLQNNVQSRLDEYLNKQ